MPTYQYACTACDERLEVVQAFSDASLTECPACQGALRKVFSAVGVVFKGSGFYKTDSRSGSTSGASASPGAATTTASDSSSAPATGGTTSTSSSSPAPAAAPAAPSGSSAA